MRVCLAVVFSAAPRDTAVIRDGAASSDMEVLRESAVVAADGAAKLDQRQSLFKLSRQAPLEAPATYFGKATDGLEREVPLQAVLETSARSTSARAGALGARPQYLAKLCTSIHATWPNLQTRMDDLHRMTFLLLSDPPPAKGTKPDAQYLHNSSALSNPPDPSERDSLTATLKERLRTYVPVPGATPGTRGAGGRGGPAAAAAGKTTVTVQVSVQSALETGESVHPREAEFKRRYAEHVDMPYDALFGTEPKASEQEQQDLQTMVDMYLLVEDFFLGQCEQYPTKLFSKLWFHLRAEFLGAPPAGQRNSSAEFALSRAQSAAPKVYRCPMEHDFKAFGLVGEPAHALLDGLYNQQGEEDVNWWGSTEPQGDYPHGFPLAQLFRRLFKNWFPELASVDDGKLANMLQKWFVDGEGTRDRQIFWQEAKHDWHSADQSAKIPQEKLFESLLSMITLHEGADTVLQEFGSPPEELAPKTLMELSGLTLVEAAKKVIADPTPLFQKTTRADEAVAKTKSAKTKSAGPSLSARTCTDMYAETGPGLFSFQGIEDFVAFFGALDGA